MSLNSYVLECLRGCLALDYQDYSIVLLPDDPVELPAALKSGRLSIMPTGKAMISAKRNLAMRTFRDAGYYAFIDSDAYPHTDWLKNGIASFTSEDIRAVGGPNLTPPGEGLQQKVVGNALKSTLVSGGHAFSKSVSGDRYCTSLHSCNLIVPARTIEHIGDFNEGLQTGEDREFCHRITRQKGKIYFNDAVIVYHHNRRLGTHFFMQRIIHGYSIFDILTKDGSRHNLVLLAPLFITIAVIAGFVSKTTWAFSTLIVALYLLKVLYDSVKNSDQTTEIPLTMLAVFTANSGYVLGNILGLCKTKLDFRKMYSNYRRPDCEVKDNTGGQD